METTLKFEVQELRTGNMTWTAVIGVSEFESLEEAMRYHDDANWKTPDWTLRGNEDMRYFRDFISESHEIVMVSHLDGGRRIIKM